VAVTDAKREREHLAQANRHIAQAQKHIAHQKKQIEKLERNGHEIDIAVSMLRALEYALRAFERHRDLILKRIKDDE
jgi:septal ring factor EnvC (AmiA/AmiB activator)